MDRQGKKYESTVSKVYGKAPEKPIKVKGPTPLYIKDGPHAGTYVAVLVYSIPKKGRDVEKREYLSRYFSKFVFKFFGNPEELRPVVDRTNPAFEDTLIYDAKNETFMVERYFYKHKQTDPMVVFVSKVSTPMTPGSIKNFSPKKKEYYEEDGNSRKTYKYKVYKKIDRESDDHEAEPEQSQSGEPADE